MQFLKVNLDMLVIYNHFYINISLPMLGSHIIKHAYHLYAYFISNKKLQTIQIAIYYLALISHNWFRLIRFMKSEVYSWLFFYSRYIFYIYEISTIQSLGVEIDPLIITLFKTKI